MTNVDEKEASYIQRVKAFVKNEHESGKLEFFTCNISRKRELSLSLSNGQVLTKAPRQMAAYTETVLQMRTAEKKAVSVSIVGLDFPSFVTNYRLAHSLSVALPHETKLQKHERYPQVELASPELKRLINDFGAVRSVENILMWLDGFASQVRHPNLMNREVGCSVNLTERDYFDSQGNEAVEESASATLSSTFSLSDTNEYFMDVLGVVPTEKDCEKVVAEASKNILKTQTRPLGDSKGIAVVLSPSALVTLLSDLVFPNLEMRSILDGTGAWGLEEMKKKVLHGLTLRDDPHLKHSPFSSTFDVEGTPSRPVTLMKEGTLEHPLFTSLLLAELRNKNSTLAECFQLTGHAESPTSAGVTNLFVEFAFPKCSHNEELLTAAKTVVVVNWLTGMSVDNLTGQFALDSEGAKVYENGELLFSTSLTLRGNFFEALTHPENKTGPVERYFNIHTPCLFTKGLSCVSKEMASSDES